LKQKETTHYLMNEELAINGLWNRWNSEITDQLDWKEQKKVFKGRNQNKKAAFETLKAKMVVTTGDNYGGSRWATTQRNQWVVRYGCPKFRTAPTLSQLENMLMEIAL
jgi:hypothetical protein